MAITVLFFATLKDRAGRASLSMPLTQSISVRDLQGQLIQQIPDLAQALPSAVAAINKEFAFADDLLKDGDEVAFFPPVSGGEGRDWPEIFRITEDTIDLNALTHSITTSATGAVCLFSGTVRGETHLMGKPSQTIHLEYEAYAPMAEAKMAQVAAEIRKRWPLVQGIAMVQRVGRLAVGEPTVLIACASGHRDQGCFEAARYGIDRLKEIVPVWKKEVGPAETHWVEGQYRPDDEDRLSPPAQP